MEKRCDKRPLNETCVGVYDYPLQAKTSLNIPDIAEEMRQHAKLKPTNSA